ncbi:tRNA/tmRNA/rRNA uracil-C5-methylase, TrmA/RlmC/RlmD family [Nocardia amikacinitolerans]|uniref:class I SAM-dependent RNA methyltransferase n=1 Tax=Nocardia amikacinitolerans TaxID=756689 RepID=UPI00082B2B86|nr:TRAM domain-containing protein [Nocardia amikacinitolerans]MCP2316041.1 tRNA/tmRNA/rRNA uracil-C5-methylase, TrmA/RlmC/RlmD family [Nocardia amikacinitolerans]
MTDWFGQTFDVRLGPPGHGGFCVGRHEGRVVFVRHGLPGELVRATVTEDRGGSFCRADAVRILEPSPDRVPPTCPVSGPGGAGCCDFSHATPAAQRALKAAVVAEQLRRLAGIEREIVVEPIAGYPDDASGGWRTRIRLPVDAEGRAGMHRYRSTEVIADLRCPQPVPGAMDGIADRIWTPGADLVVAVDGDGVRHLVELPPAEQVTARRGRRHGGGPRGRRRDGGNQGAERPRGVVGPSGRVEERAEDPDEVRREAVARRAASHAARDEWVVDGTGRAVEYVAGRRWEVAATGFWQAHRLAAQCYSDLVADWSGLDSGDLAWDLYSGAGVFAARLADRVGSRGSVLAVESARSAVADGHAALRDLPWVDLRAERVERWVAEHVGGAAPRAVVLDPPRAGAGKEVVAAVATAGPARIVHVGCDPAAFARDLGLYQSHGYRLTDLRAFDAFPATHHVECLALLER